MIMTNNVFEAIGFAFLPVFVVLFIAYLFTPRQEEENGN